MAILIMTGQLLLSLSILVVLHELGHFIPAKLFGTRVEKFYLFFNPGFSLFKKQIGETEYGIGWLPLGGYVKIAGMVDESLDLEQLKEPPQPWEFRAKPAWQRLIIMLGGVTVNFLLGFFLFGMILWQWGEEYLPNSELKWGIAVDSVGMELGLRDGDKILQLGDQPFVEFSVPDFIRSIVLEEATYVLVDRNGERVRIDIDPKWVTLLSSREIRQYWIMMPRTPFYVAEAVPGSPAEQAGIQVDDHIIAVDTVPTPFFIDFRRAILKRKGQETTIGLVRQERDTLRVRLTVPEEGTIGVYNYAWDHYFRIERREYTLAEALPAGVVKGWNFLKDQVKAFALMFQGKMKAKDNLGSFISIGKMFGDTWDWERFWRMTALLSLVLGFVNLLPVPALDGGHVMFLLYEIATGRKPSDKFLEYATLIGFILLATLMLYVIGLDILRIF